jgi:hypothetical protein
MGCSLKTSDKNAGKWPRNMFLQNDVCFLGLGSKHANKLYTQNKIKIKHPGKYTSLQNVGVLQRAGGYTKPTILYGFFVCTPFFCTFFARPRGL